MCLNRPAYLRPLHSIFINVTYCFSKPNNVNARQLDLLHSRRTVNAGNRISLIQVAVAGQLI